MRGSARAPVIVGLALALAIAGIAGCGRFGDATAGSDGAANAAVAEMTELTLEAQALEEIGFIQQENGPAPSPSADGKDNGTRHDKRVRFGFRKGMLHGEAVVQTDQGTKTVVVQRGTVTAIDASTVTVKSSDGFTLTWTFGSPLNVLEHRRRVQPSAVVVGTEVGVAGARQGDLMIAQLIVVPGRK
jgi:hypothetical protein